MTPMYDVASGDLSVCLSVCSSRCCIVSKPQSPSESSHRCTVQ